MADIKKPAVVKALIFKSSKKNGVLDNNKVQEKGSRVLADKLVPKELNFFDMTPNAERKPFKPTENNNSRMKPSRMLVYEDSPGDDDTLKNTPPNVMERDGGTPGAPMKSRKDIEKKILRPKKLVYNDADEDYSSYRDTPKKSSRKETEDLFGTARRRIFTSGERVVDKSRGQAGSRKKNSRDGGRARNDKINYNKENDAAVRLGALGAREKFESQKNRAAVGSREEVLGSSTKLGELTHFRI